LVGGVKQTVNLGAVRVCAGNQSQLASKELLNALQEAFYQQLMESSNDSPDEEGG